MPDEQQACAADLNSDGNMLITGVGGTASARLNVLTLETNTVYLLEIGIAGGDLLLFKSSIKS